MPSASPRLWRTDKMKKLGSQDYSLHERPAPGASGSDDAVTPTATATTTTNTGAYRTYKRRWFGLIQLTLMNIVVSWGWLTFAPVASLSATYYQVSESAINWLSTAFFLSFVLVFPLTILALQHGPRLSLSIAAALILLSSWIRYAGATSKAPDGGKFAFAMASEILIGFAQPFVLAAPTRYSDLWFTNRGRVGATAVMTLANPLGAALGQLINPFWATKSTHISNMVLYVSIISTVAALPSFFVPAAPPTPVGPSSETPKLRLRASLSALRSLELWLILIPFWVYVGFFNNLSSLLNQMLVPYGFSDDEAGIAGAILIVVGLLTAAVTSPIIDRTKAFLLAIKIFIPIIAVSYLIFVWMPETKALPGPYVVLALLGASCFALVPVALECLIELSHPLSPAVTSTFAWAGGQLFGAIFVIVSDALVAGKDASPPKNMKRALIFQAVIAVAAAPLPMMLGLFGRKEQVTLRRIQSDTQGRTSHVEDL